MTHLLMEFEKAKVERKQLAKLTYQNIELRMDSKRSVNYVIA